jgi:hypothetical protein
MQILDSSDEFYPIMRKSAAFQAHGQALPLNFHSLGPYRSQNLRRLDIPRLQML